jgi:hypothetical protein
MKKRRRRIWNFLGLKKSTEEVVQKNEQYKSPVEQLPEKMDQLLIALLRVIILIVLLICVMYLFFFNLDFYDLYRIRNNTSFRK